MHPAISVIFFTVTSGAGFGLIFLIALGWPMSGGMVPAFLVSLLAGGLAVAGLISSTFHLGHPERAWRAFSQWRSSWLSREGVFAVITLVLFALYALVWMFSGMRMAMLGYPIAIFSVLTVYSTAMIYAQLKTIPNWHSVLTPVCYLSFALSSALILASLIGHAETVLSIPVSIAAALVLVAAWIAKLVWWSRADKIGFSDTGSDSGTATGLGSLGEVKLLEKPHSGENYLTREMVHQIGRKHARKLRMIALIFGLALPLVLCFLAHATGLATLFLAIAFISMMAGLIAERWLFFAEAKHSVSLYY